MAIRFVPFATFGGKPKKIKTGRVKREPPPARVFITPAKKPTITRIAVSM
jgi:hypothetical protein